MKPEQPDAHLVCAACGHTKERHAQVCGNRDCHCICFLRELPSGPPEADAISSEQWPAPEQWQEDAMMQVLDMLMEEREGDIEIKAKNGRLLKIKIRLIPEVGYVVTSAGGSA